MHEIIDLSQEVFAGMPVHKVLPEVKLSMHSFHKEWEGITNSDTVSPSVDKLEFSDHTEMHVDALNYIGSSKLRAIAVFEKE